MVRPRYRTKHLESTVESNAVSTVLAKFGVFSIKLKRTTETGHPDRIYLLPGGKPLFVEYKRPGETPRAKQTLIHERLTYFGYKVETHTSAQQTLETLEKLLK